MVLGSTCSFLKYTLNLPRFTSICYILLKLSKKAPTQKKPQSFKTLQIVLLENFDYQVTFSVEGTHRKITH